MINNDTILNTILSGDTRETLKTISDNSIDTIITSPPYWSLRSYGEDENEIGRELLLTDYIEHLLQVTFQLKRVLKPSGIMFWVHGDNWASKGGASRHKGYSDPKYKKGRDGSFVEPSAFKQGNIRSKSLFLQNSRLAIRMMNRWGGETTDDYTGKYTKTASVIQENGKSLERERNLRPNPYGKNHDNTFEIEEENPSNFWKVNTKGFPGSHTATFPEKLIEPLIKVGCPSDVCPECGFIRQIIFEPIGDSSATLCKNIDKTKFNSQQGQVQNLRGGVPESYLRKRKIIEHTSCSCNKGFKPGIVLDPFMGAGTTALVALKNNRSFIGIELNQEYRKDAEERIKPYLYMTPIMTQKQT